MLVQVQGLVQVSFNLQVRKADTTVLSTTQLAILIDNMDTMQRNIISKGYLVKAQMIVDGVRI